ncbi:Protein Wnt-4 [Eumeta japonica]|uniref:Protein Wnt n=1 Tax=Eumeta variegata TaxID=151549 RepID=A0A4C1UZ87_EUMVA|nr:Protein Wnt-4 [Eumeta japonica]
MITRLLFVLIILNISATNVTEGSQPVLQKTVTAMFTDRSNLIYPGHCKWIKASNRQSQICHRDPGFPEILAAAKAQAINACQESFQYDRWNCSLVFNNKLNKGVMKKLCRETSFIYALMAGSMTHAIDKGCASGDLVRCSCARKYGKDNSWQWKRGGCGDDYKYGKRITRNFLDFKHAGNDQMAEILKQDSLVGMDGVVEQLREVCKCHGFSGSCTTKTCWKRLGPFGSSMGLLKKHYHHAVKAKLVNFTSKRAISAKVKKRLKVERKGLAYLHKTPNLCSGTVNRICRDRDNCATLCCARGYNTSQRVVKSRCRCRMANCCFVECDTFPLSEFRRLRLDEKKTDRKTEGVYSVIQMTISHCEIIRSHVIDRTWLANRLIPEIKLIRTPVYIALI